MRTGRKLAILAVPLLLLGGVVLYFSRVMEPIKEGSAADFWHAACHVQLDPNTNNQCIGPTYPPRDGCFPYAGKADGLIYFHGAPEFYVTESKALADFQAVVRALAADEHLDEGRPLRGKIVDAGYRAWLIANPEGDDAHCLLACVREAWLDHFRRLDRSRPDFNYSAYLSQVEAENAFDMRWETAKLWRGTSMSEFVYLFFLVSFAAWPWIRNAKPWKWALHLGLLLPLLFLPYWLGYAPWTFTSAEYAGGALYPELIRPFRGLPWTSLDTWALKKLPKILSWVSPSPGPMRMVRSCFGRFRRWWGLVV